MVKPELDETVQADRTPALDETQPAPTAPLGSATATRATGVTKSLAAGLPAGKQLGHFRIERPLGAGGMGEVYLATDLALDRAVAVKVLPDELTDHPKRRERMIREARAQARVTHPHVAHMYFIGEDGGRLYLAMEYLAGKTLAERLDEGPLPVDEALALIRAAALGLREAQRSGFTHRDVKPSNLMVDGHGVLKLLDFGLAAGRDDAGVEAGATGPVAQTSFAGTPLYMAPEQARGEPIDFRADIYALGATLYHLVSGKPPFQADSVEELFSLHATAARPAVPRRGIPRTQSGAVDALVGKMMAARPEDRFASYDELLRAIELASASHTRPAGFWVRSIAVFVDLIAVLIVSVLVETVFVKALDTDGLEISMSEILPVLGLYSALAIGRWGRTFGKAVFELEVVDVDTGHKPPWPRAIRRALVLYGPPGALAWLADAFDALDENLLHAIAGGLSGVLVFAAFALLLYASARVSGKRTWWDRSAGTMVRYRTTRTSTL
ncbi:MAG TPA: protein kinase [Kofleriaceae bacterium]|nr:protein kinase [Kofleriaceae bacterium]